jgi:hypothetical protein
VETSSLSALPVVDAERPRGALGAVDLIETAREAFTAVIEPRVRNKFSLLRRDRATPDK